MLLIASSVCWPCIRGTVAPESFPITRVELSAPHPVLHAASSQHGSSPYKVSDISFSCCFVPVLRYLRPRVDFVSYAYHPLERDYSPTAILSCSGQLSIVPKPRSLIYGMVSYSLTYLPVDLLRYALNIATNTPHVDHFSQTPQCILSILEE